MQFVFPASLSVIGAFGASRRCRCTGKWRGAVRGRRWRGCLRMRRFVTRSASIAAVDRLRPACRPRSRHCRAVALCCHCLREEGSSYTVFELYLIGDSRN